MSWILHEGFYHQETVINTPSTLLASAAAAAAGWLQNANQLLRSGYDEHEQGGVRPSIVVSHSSCCPCHAISTGAWKGCCGVQPHQSGCWAVEWGTRESGEAPRAYPQTCCSSVSREAAGACHAGWHSHSALTTSSLRLGGQSLRHCLMGGLRGTPSCTSPWRVAPEGPQSSLLAEACAGLPRGPACHVTSIERCWPDCLRIQLFAQP